MSKQQDKLMHAVRTGNLDLIYQEQQYLDANPNTLYYLALMAAKNNYLEAERLLKKQILEKFHKNLSELAKQTANGHTLPNYEPYKDDELLEALDIARFTKQPLEIRSLLKSELKKRNYSDKDLICDEDKASKINRKYLGEISPYLSISGKSFYSMLFFGTFFVLAAIITAAILIFVMTPLFMVVPLAALCLWGLVISEYEKSRQLKIICDKNLETFTSDEKKSNASHHLKAIQENTTKEIDKDNTFAVTPEARANIEKLNELSPGLIDALTEHFSKRADLIQEYLTSLKQHNETDNTELQILKMNWDTLMKTAQEDPEEFCRAVTSYLENFEKGFKLTLEKGSTSTQSISKPYAEREKAQLFFTTKDKEIQDNIQEIKTKIALTKNI